MPWSSDDSGGLEGMAAGAGVERDEAGEGEEARGGVGEDFHGVG